MKRLSWTRAAGLAAALLLSTGPVSAQSGLDRRTEESQGDEPAPATKRPSGLAGLGARLNPKNIGRGRPAPANGSRASEPVSNSITNGSGEPMRREAASAAPNRPADAGRTVAAHGGSSLPRTSAPQSASDVGPFAAGVPPVAAAGANPSRSTPDQGGVGPFGRLDAQPVKPSSQTVPPGMAGLSPEQRASLEAELSLEQRLTDSERLRKQALASGDTQRLAQADELEAEARATYRRQLETLHTLSDPASVETAAAPRGGRENFGLSPFDRGRPIAANERAVGDEEPFEIEVQRPEDFGRMRRRALTAAPAEPAPQPIEEQPPAGSRGQFRPRSAAEIAAETRTPSRDGRPTAAPNSRLAADSPRLGEARKLSFTPRSSREIQGEPAELRTAELPPQSGVEQVGYSGQRSADAPATGVRGRTVQPADYQETVPLRELPTGRPVRPAAGGQGGWDDIPEVRQAAPLRATTDNRWSDDVDTPPASQTPAPTNFSGARLSPSIELIDEPTGRPMTSGMNRRSEEEFAPNAAEAERGTTYSASSRDPRGGAAPTSTARMRTQPATGPGNTRPARPIDPAALPPEQTIVR